MLKAARFVPEARKGARWLSLSLATAAMLVVTSSGWFGCPMLRVFHHGCPTCGVSRALALLTRGQLAASFQLQPLALPAVSSSWLTLAAGLEGVLRSTRPCELVRANRWLLLATTGIYCGLIWLWLTAQPAR